LELPSWCKLPMKGRPSGPGGKQAFLVVLFLLIRRNKRKMGTDRIRKSDKAIVIDLCSFNLYNES
jgi:hypothetical protein